MDDELRILHEAMVVKERLKVLAELQSSYWDELLARGFDQSVAEQLMMEWSRHAYGMTFRAIDGSSIDAGIDDLLGTVPSSVEAPPDGAQPPAPPRSSGDPSSVPLGEPWLQLVQDVEASDDEDADADTGDQRAA